VISLNKGRRFDFICGRWLTGEQLSLTEGLHVHPNGLKMPLAHRSAFFRESLIWFVI
jgi:hypothetical protein